MSNQRRLRRRIRRNHKTVGTFQGMPVVDGGTLPDEVFFAIVNGMHGQRFTCPDCEEAWTHFGHEPDPQVVEGQMHGDYRCPECSMTEVEQ